jgi:hypothetical protein
MKFLIYFISLLFIGCNPYHEYDGNLIAKDYCRCIHLKNPTNKPNNYWYAKKVCDGLMTEKYFFFRCNEITIGLEQSNRFNDSLRRFGSIFQDAVRKNCCEFVGTCSDSTGSRKN